VTPGSIEFGLPGILEVSSFEDAVLEEFLDGGAERNDCGFEVPRKLLKESTLGGGCGIGREDPSKLCRREESYAGRE
jgi:hypothetical protein